MRTLMRVASATGFELLLGPHEVDSDPPSDPSLNGLEIRGALLPAWEDDLADFVVCHELSIFDGPPL